MNKDEEIKEAIEIYEKRMEFERNRFAEIILEIFTKIRRKGNDWNNKIK